MIEHPSEDQRRPLRVLPWWVAIVGAVLIAASITATTLCLLSIAGRDSSLRIEAIKTGLTVGAGTGGAIALLLALRRQWLNERAQAHTEDVARENAYDATQRRVTELYAKAVEQLGHDKAAVRLGGLHSLERLAQDHSEHRQTVVDVVCAYLRMPFHPPADARSVLSDVSTQPSPQEQSSGHLDAMSDQSSDRQELQVRLTAQRLLTRHLAVLHDDTVGQPAPLPERHWPDIQIDLTGAVLIDFDFTRCDVHNADFRRTHFIGDALFADAHFSGTALFDDVQFSGRACFGKAQFSGHAWFEKAQFVREALFNDAQFSDITTFSEAHFIETAEFNDAQFSKVSFNDARFNGGTFFSGAKFNEVALFFHAQFDDTVGFQQTQFDGAEFMEAEFVGVARFDGAQFSASPSFKSARAIDIPDHEWPPGWRIEPPLSSSDTLMGRLIRDVRTPATRLATESG